MQRSKIIFTVILSLFTTFALAEEILKRGDLEKSKNVFVIKADKDFVGATIEIYSSTGQFITSQNLQKRKIAIDFSEVKFGVYTIRITKGDSVQEYQYVKN